MKEFEPKAYFRFNMKSKKKHFAWRDTIGFWMIFFIWIPFLVHSQNLPSEISISKTERDTFIKSTTITGTVSNVEPLPNIVVIEKGHKKNTAITSQDGNFSLEIPLEHFTRKVILRFEVLGKKPVEKQITATTRHLKVHFDPDKPPKEKWKIDFIFQKPETSEIINHELDKLLFLVENVQKN